MASALQEINTGLIIREAKTQELDIVHELQERVLRLGGHKNRDQKTGGGVIMVALLGEIIVGTGHVNKSTDEGHVEIECLAVHPDWQGHGIGSELLARLEEKAMEGGAHTAKAITFDAEDFYKNNQYVRKGKILSGNEPEYYMVKKLNPVMGAKEQV